MGLPVSHRLDAQTFLESDPPQPRPTIISTRWPHTYAYDYMRSHPESVPDDAKAYVRAEEMGYGEDMDHAVSKRLIPSRGQAAQVLKAWAVMLDGVQTKDDLMEQLALAYLIEYHYDLESASDESVTMNIRAALKRSGVPNA